MDQHDDRLSDADDPRDQFAEFRTDLAEDRTIMAMERTFAGWMRTAFAAIGIGLAFHVVFDDFEPPWLAKGIATMFILAGGLLGYAAQRRTCATLGRLHSHEMKTASSPNFRLLGYAVLAGAILLSAGLWVLNDGTVAG